MLTNKRVTNAITGKYSFEASVLDMFKNLFYKKDETQFDPEATSNLDRDFSKIIDSTFLKPKWVKDNCKEMVELNNHTFPFLAMIEPKDEFVTSDELIAAVEMHNKKLKEMLTPYLNTIKWGNEVFEAVNKEMQTIRPGDKDFSEGYVDDEDLSEEEYEKGISIIDSAITKYKKEYEKKSKELKPIDFKFSPYLENKQSEFKLVGKSVDVKITAEEMIEFLKKFKSLEIVNTGDLLFTEDLAPYFDYDCTLYSFEYGRTDFHEYTFSRHVRHHLYPIGRPEKFFSIKTLTDVLKQFIDK